MGLSDKHIGTILSLDMTSYGIGQEYDDVPTPWHLNFGVSMPLKQRLKRFS